MDTTNYQVVLSSTPVYMQLHVKNNKLIKVSASHCPCKRGFKCRHKVALLCIVMSLGDSCTGQRQSWHRNAYLPMTAELERDLAQITSTKQDITELQFKSEDIDRVKGERKFHVRLPPPPGKGEGGV